jgi:RNA polymerase sigma-70 factor (ECF subfamily)
MKTEIRSDGLAATDPAVWPIQHGDMLFRYALAWLRSRELAEDLVQETFLAALRARERFQGQSSEQTWLVGILRRKIVDHIRKAERSRSASEVECLHSDFFGKRGHWKSTVAKWPSDPHQVLENREFWDVFGRCLSKLPASLADAFCLREMEDIDTSEICNILGISATNLSVRLHRARLLLRRCLDLNWFTPQA